MGGWGRECTHALLLQTRVSRCLSTHSCGMVFTYISHLSAPELNSQDLGKNQRYSQSASPTFTSIPLGQVPGTQHEPDTAGAQSLVGEESCRR